MEKKGIGYSWSLDISTTNVGMALWDEKGKLVEVRHLKLETDKSVPEEIRYLSKADLFNKYVVQYKNDVEIKYGAKIENVFLEAPLFQTSVNINTTAKLLGFNGICCYILYLIFGVPPYLISVYQSRKLFFPELVNIKRVKGKIKETLSFPKDIDKKVYIWNKVALLYPEIKWTYKKTGEVKETCFDISDSIVVGLAGFKVINGINNES